MFDLRIAHAARSSARRLSSAAGASAAAVPRVYRGLLVLLFLVVLLAPVAALADPLTAPLAQSGTYVVQRGDTLSSIAARFGVSATALARANGITNPNFVWVGQRLVIPGGAAPAPQPAPGPTTGGTYVVQPGDTLARIAARFGTTVSALMSANGLRNANFIYVGQRLVVGSGVPAPGPTPRPQQPPAPPTPKPPTGSKAGRWIDVDLTHQRLTAYDGKTPVFTTLVSTGLPGTPTVVGTFKIYIKLASTRRRGPGYDLPNVPYTMYFYGGYGLHGTYWHNNFGHPMSHGCVNLSTQDAAWLFGWASVGTTVVTHY